MYIHQDGMIYKSWGFHMLTIPSALRARFEAYLHNGTEVHERTAKKQNRNWNRERLK